MPPKVAFLVKNRFQIAQFQRLAASWANAQYLLMNRRSLRKEFTRQDIEASSVPVTVVDRHSLRAIAGQYDAIFFQTAFAGMEQIENTPLVSVQYGLAKERHNYGEWRSLADMNLMYGPYSAKIVSHFSPAYAVGNIKFAGWNYRSERGNPGAAKRRLGLDPELDTILYMPTYGELGSFDALVEPLAALRHRFNVVIKMHHNNETEGRAWAGVAESHGHRNLYHGDSDQTALLAAADVVVSDFSGAIFDAVYAGVPVVLFQPDAQRKVGTQKFDLSSPEFARRDEIGLVCEDTASLPSVIGAALDRRDELIGKAAGIRQEMFVDGSENDTIKMIHDRVDDLLAGRIPRLSKPQLYVRESVRRLMIAERQIRQMKSKPWPLRRAGLFIRKTSARLWNRCITAMT